MITELFIENERADISTTLASLLTLAIDDIKDFSSRQTSFSKTIVAPGSLRNNILFGNVFEISTTNDYDPSQPNINMNFNASVSAKCLIFQDNLQTFKGSARLLQINIDRGKIEYEIAITGELSTLNVRLSSGLLEDLDFSAYNHTYNTTNIIASWDNPGGSGYYYPHIDYGNYSTDKHNWSVYTFRPALYVKEYIDKIFEAAEFRYSSALFDTARFESLIIPYNRAQLTSLGSGAMEAGISGTETDSFISFDNISGTDWTLENLDREITYNGGVPLNGTIDAFIAGQYYNEDITVNLAINGVTVASQTFIFPGGAFPNFFTWTPSVTQSMSATDYITVFITESITGPGNTLATTTANIDFNLSIPTLLPVAYLDAIQMNDVIPKNIRQIDFLLSIVKLFNLYITEDKFDENLLYIEPYVDFYSEDSQNAVDWTYKLDRNKPFAIQPMSEINAKIYNFSYADDSDYYNEIYKKRYNQTYGSQIFDTEFEFVDQTQDVKLIFASTPIVGYGGEDKIYPTIFKLNDNVEENVDSVIRIMQTKKVTGVTSWDILDEDMVTVLDSVTNYGYAGHIDDPDAPANDLNFGAPEELFFVLVSGDLSANQFNVYWSPYMAEITDKDSKLFSGWFYLQPKDIQDLDFSKYVNVDGNLFRLNKIIDYNMTKPDTCKIELLRVINTVY